jgi:hypothetical protein
MNGPKVCIAGFSKTWLYAGTSEDPALPATKAGDNATGADNQQGSRPVPGTDPSETTRRAPTIESAKR